MKWVISLIRVDARMVTEVALTRRSRRRIGSRAVADLARAVQTVVRRCLGISRGENVLVLCDPDRVELAEALREEALAAGADAVLMVVPPDPRRGTEPPPTVAAALRAADCYVAPMLPSLSHTRARKAATELGVRGATMPGATAELVARVMDVDLDALGSRSRAVADALTAGAEAHLTCPLGSDFRMDLRDRVAISDDGNLTAAGAFGNLPCGEGFVSPARGEGRIVASSLAGVGLVEEPVTLVISDDRLAEASGTAGERFLALLDAYGSRGRNVAELGVGTSDGATLTGNILEDEKILGTAHVAFGASAAIGGTVEVPVHLDVVVLDASLEVDGRPVLARGELVAA
jgi:leucyl aminopeptidase (aminopeptidase T)